MATKKQLKFNAGEKWKTLPLKRGVNGHRYSISSYGRIVSYNDNIKTGQELKTRLTENYPSVTLQTRGVKQNHYVHRLVATHFVKQKSKTHKYVIHLDYKKENNKASNLRWANKDEMYKHQQKSPAVIKAKKVRRETGYSLKPKDVREIKKALANKKKPPTLKSLAKKYKVSDMQIHRIKIGENWGHI